MAKVRTGGLIVASVAALLGTGLGSRPSLAHNDWGLPLVGGLVGGYALSSMMHRPEEHRVREQPVYAAPPPPPPAAPAAPAAPAPSAASTAATVEHQLNVLDDLAAKGYITKDECQARRQALLNQL